MPIVTKKWLLSCRTRAGGWTAAQLAELGLSWPPQHGWHEGLIGKEVTEAQYNRFCSLRNKKKKRSK